tara:strand:- start:1483 stop:2616 length:1134 start_codon:yes stop_codon:yes gene_type:complete
MAAKAPFVTVDTEFLREKTYYAKLCLIQLAYDGDQMNDSALIDVLSQNISLEPIYTLFRNPKVVKVFHAARQDLEIFYLDKQVIPSPFFDTQLAAMVCGYGDQVGYETIVKSLLSVAIDKSNRFTDWSKRPLTEKQISYALADVTHLREVFRKLLIQLEENKRSHWVEDEIEILMKPKTYINEPMDAWKRLKTKNTNPKFLNSLKFLAGFREKQAQQRNLPRNRVLKDEVLIEMATLRPTDFRDLKRSRFLQVSHRSGWIAEGILGAIKCAQDTQPSFNELSTEPVTKKPSTGGLADLMRVLLKAKSEQWGVAQKLIASTAELDVIVSEIDPDVPSLRGWRKKVFGDDALKLKSGLAALTVNNGSVEIIEIPKKIVN